MGASEAEAVFRNLSKIKRRGRKGGGAMLSGEKPC